MKHDRKLLALPIDSILPELVQALEQAPNLVLQASPGSGKTTRVPPALLQAAFRQDREILVLEPRRLAAKYAARRVADELGEEVGGTVGYQFRFENVSSPRTRLRFLTEGMLMRRLLRDPRLEGVAVVLLDEFHERHLHGDIALGYLRWLQANGRPDLRIVVMSATLDSESVANYLGGCPILRVDTRLFPVENEFLPSPAAKPLEFLVKEAVSRALREGGRNGNVLVFLPGMGEIRRCAEALQPLAGSGPGGVRILPLHGELSREEQDLAVGRSDFTKVILSTNVAETSLTIEGVTTVIDSGLHRSASYSWWSGVPALRTRPISRASAIQRAGRAGRTAPGRCLRLYTQWEYESRPAFEVPEIQRADITQTLLELKQLGILDASAFPWFEAPSPQSLEAASLLLFRLGAIDAPQGKSKLTALGRRMAELPAHPRLARVCLEAEKLKVLDDAATLVALIGEGRLERLDALENLAGAENDAGVRRIRSQLLSSFPPRGPALSSSTLSSDERLRFSLLAGFPDRVARKRKIPAHSNRARGNEVELLFSAGGSARIEETGVIADGEDFVTLDLQETQQQGQTRAQLRIRCLSPIKPEWLFDLEPSLLREEEVLTWDTPSAQVVLVAKMTHDQLVLTESRKRPESTPENQEEILRVLLRGALGLEIVQGQVISYEQWVQSLSQVGDPEAISNAFHRILLLWKHFPPESGSGPERFQERLQPLLAGKLSLRELKETDWANELPAALIPEYLDRVGSYLPEKVTLPGGRQVKVNYPPDQPPWIESRLQDFFGMKQGPSILNGRIPLTLHLLAPNYRAVQVTTDLAGFWQRGYKEIKPALSRRYPRHPWPEDPANAQPPEPKPQRGR